MSRGTSLGVLTLLFLTLPTLTAGYLSPHASTTCYSSVSQVIASRFPALSNYVDLNNYTMASSNLNYTDMKILDFRWVSRGASVEVQTTEKTCEIIRFEAIVDARYFNESVLNNLLSKLEAGIKEWYSDSKNLVSNIPGAEVLGGQLVINNAPIYFLDPDYVVVTPVVIRYFIYPSPPIVIYAFINYFPVVDELLTQIPNFSLSEEEVVEILKNKINITEYRGITKSYVILYRTLRPAYIVAVTPYKNVAILADSGEILTQKTTTTSQETLEGNQATAYVGLALVLIASAIVITYLTWLRRR